MNNTIVLDYIKNIISNVETIKKQMGILDNEDSFVCFRGEDRDYGETKLTPSLFRDNKHMLLDRELVELLSDYDIPTNTNSSLLSKTIDGQHFVQTSRLLDVTFSILPALYFASADSHEDGYIYSFVFLESFSPNSSYLNKYYDRIVEEEFSPYAKDFKVVTHSYNNERVKLQNGGFILFSGITFNKIPIEYYNEPIKIDSKDKKIIREELSKYFNISEATIYPEKDKRKSVILKNLSKNRHTFRATIENQNSIELDCYLRRIELELTVKKAKGISATELKRFLRKERKNIFYYLKKNFKSESLLEKEAEVSMRFKFIEKEL